MSYGNRAFFFYGSAAHGDLHSFPTRRSSDLLFHRHVGDRPRRRLFLAAVGFFLTLALARFMAYAAGRGIGPFHYIYIDRKSTRLNSSHVSISYAVFCLKKKTGIMRTLAVLIV